MEHDGKDLQTVLDYVCERAPFNENTKDLRSLSSGIMADTPVNVNSAEAIGTTIVRRMEGQTVAGFKFSKKEQVTTLASAVYVAFDGEKIEIDPQQLYQRLRVAGVGTIDIQTLFQYELCSYPTSLFDKHILICEWLIKLICSMTWLRGCYHVL